MAQLKLVASVAAAFFVLSIAGGTTFSVLAAENDAPPATAPSPTGELAQPGHANHLRAFGGGGAATVVGGQANPMMQWRVNTFSPTTTTAGNGLATSKMLQTIEELNVSPDFSLTADEKTKILTARQEGQAAHDKWLKDHQQELDQLQKTILNTSAHQNQQELSAALLNLQQINRDGSNTDVMDASIEEALTPEHKKVVDEKLAPQSGMNSTSPQSIKPVPAPVAPPGQ